MGENSSHSITRTTDKGTCWSITLNNPSVEEVALWNNIAKHATFVKKSAGQIEKGENGTPHIQGMLMTDSVRFSAVKKLLPRAHIEKARNVKALEQYATKEETRIAPLISSKREVLMATPATVQGRLYSSCMPVVLHNDLTHCEVDGKIYFKLLPRLGQKIDDTPSAFVQRLKGDSQWKSYFRQKADVILHDIYAELIEEGYYNVEFMAANNLVNGGFKKFLYEIIIRHALHSPSPCPSSQEQSPQDFTPPEVV